LKIKKSFKVDIVGKITYKVTKE